MRKLFYFVLFVSAALILHSCMKGAPDNPGCTAKPIASDTAALLKFAADSIRPLTYDSSGIFYKILDSGDQNLKPVFSTNIKVNYVGRLMNGVIFDSASNTNLNGTPLYGLIYGWQYGLPKIGKGGHIQLLIPSALAWGCTGYGQVPADAPVYFDVELLDVN
jgi:FKBP-type peptidyl-prolyl cis-trans isomerase FkpA